MAKNHWRICAIPKTKSEASNGYSLISQPVSLDTKLLHYFRTSFIPYLNLFVKFFVHIYYLIQLFRYNFHPLYLFRMNTVREKDLRIKKWQQGLCRAVDSDDFKPISAAVVACRTFFYDILQKDTLKDSTSKSDMRRFQRSLDNLQLWDAELQVSAGELDRKLSGTAHLRQKTLQILTSLSKILYKRT
jgi:hypothetical protein